MTLDDELSDLCGEMEEQPATAVQSTTVSPQQDTFLNNISLDAAELIIMGVAAIGTYVATLIQDDPSTLYRSMIMTPMIVFGTQKVPFLDNLRYSTVLLAGSVFGYTTGQFF